MNTTALAPLESLYEVERGPTLQLPPDLASLFGRLQFPLHPGRPHVIGNFVSTLDGVVTFNIPGQSGGGPISGFNPYDHLVMGLLRAVADAVIFGSGTLRAVSQEHRWTATYIYPALARAYQHLRASLLKEEQPLNVIVTARGEVNMALPLFQSGDVPVLIVTTPQGEGSLREQRIPPGVQIACVPGTLHLSAQEIFQAVCLVRDCTMILVEGGPHLQRIHAANDPTRQEQLKALQGNIAIANARLAYQEFKRLFSGPRFAVLRRQGACVQRPLWASIGTKNPAYRDVLYVEALIGSDTVNTMPLKTIESFRDHGRVRLSIEDHLRAAQAHLAALASVGIDYDQVTRQLQEEGIQTFANSFRTLFACIDNKRKKLQA